MCRRKGFVFFVIIGSIRICANIGHFASCRCWGYLRVSVPLLG